MDLVARLFNDGQGVWNELLQNDFCQNYMKEKPAGDEETLEGFKWYMRVRGVSHCLPPYDPF